MTDIARSASKLRQSGNLALDICISLAAAVALLLIRGYLFPSANHGQELPPIMAILNPGLFANDLSVQSFLEPGPRWVYQQIIAALVTHTPLNMPASFLLLHFTAMTSIALALLRLSRAILEQADLTDTSHTHGLWMLLVVATFTPMHSWASPFAAAWPVPSVFAMGLAAWSLPLAVRGRWLLAFLLLGAAAALQFLVGLLLGAVLLPGLLLHTLRSKQFAQCIAALGVWGFALASIYLPMAATARPTPDDFNFLEVFGLYRVPHHWVPSTAPLSEWVADAFLWAAGGVALWAARRSELLSRSSTALLGGMLSISALGVVANWVFVEMIPLEIVGKLQFQRIMPFGQMAAHIAVFLILIGARRWSLLALLAATIPLAGWPMIAFVTAMIAARGERNARPSPSSIFLISAVVLASLLVFPVEPEIISRAIALSGLLSAACWASTRIFTRGVGLVPTLALTMPALLLWALLFMPQVYDRGARMIIPNIPQGAVEQRLARRWSFDISRHLAGVEIARIARSEVPIDAVVLTSPTWEAIPTMFPMLSERSVFFAHKNVPYSNHGVWEWAERAQELLGAELAPFMSKDERKRLFAGRTATEIMDIARAHELCYTLLPHVDGREIPGEVLATEKHNGALWSLKRLPGCD